MSDSTRDLAAFLNGRLDDARTASPELRQGVVQTVAGARVTLTLAGTSSIARAAYLTSYVPTIGDTVWVLRNGTDLLVLGNITGPTTVGSLPNNGANAQGGTAQSNSTATYQNLLAGGGALTATVSKKNAGSALLVQMTASAYSSAAGVVAQFIAFDTGVGIGSAFPISQFYFNAANQHQTIAGQTKLFGVPAGNRSIVLQFRNNGGAGSVSTDGNDFFSLSVTETAT